MKDYTVTLAFEGERPPLYMTTVQAAHPRAAVRLAAVEARSRGRNLDLWTDTITIEGEHKDQTPAEYVGASARPPVDAIEGSPS